MDYVALYVEVVDALVRVSSLREVEETVAFGV
jgi:hypothetical protein